MTWTLLWVTTMWLEAVNLLVYNNQFFTKLDIHKKKIEVPLDTEQSAKVYNTREKMNLDGSGSFHRTFATDNGINMLSREMIYLW